MASESGQRASGSTALTVERAADVLLLFGAARGPLLGVTEIANALALSKPAVHRILASLRNKGLITVDEGTRKYSLGPAMVCLGLAYLDKLDVVRLAGPELASLSQATDETATLSVRTGWTRVYVDQVTPDREVLMAVQIGVPYPLHAGASSKAFLAFLPEAEIERYLHEPLAKVTPATRVDVPSLRTELEEIRRRGFARSEGERQPGAGSVAAPLLDHRDRPLAVISVCGPAERLAAEVDHCVERLLVVAARISARLGRVATGT
ncbi:MAG: IclR family transcriptional regulator [Actinomycetota bacterium]|nr:IclR family transcriptional regulator [Actinomycetota bacterium]